MNVGRNPLQVSSLQPQSAMAKLLKRLVSVVLILVSVSVTQISSEKVVRATALTCAEGGTCVVGDIGPGGGIIFYVSRLNFTSTSSNCNTECKYLEVAPSGWNGGSDPLGNLSVGIPLVGSHSVTIGSIVYDDWFLPSIVQLNQLCRWHRNVLPLLDYLYTSVTYGKNYECPGATLPNTGVGASAAGILGGRYLSSSAEGANVWDQDQSLGYNFYGSNQHSRYIRPVRAFSPGLVVTYNSQSGSAVSAGSTTSGGEIASAPVAPTRTGYVFTGWFAASTGGSAITFPYTHSQTADFTLHAQWSQASLHGISSVSKIGTITTTANVGNTFAVDTESSSVSLRYPANGLPENTVIDVYLVNDLSRARSLIVPAGGFVVSLVVAWLAADGSVPLMASGKPLSMTIANDTIKAGAKTYAIVGGEVTLLGTASVNGSVTISITEDPEIVVVNPVVVAQPSSSQPSSSQPSSSQPSSSQPSSSQPSSSLPTAGVKKNPSKATNLLPQIPGATSKIAAILNAVAGQLPPKPKVFAPRVLSNGQIARIAFTPIQIKAPPANAPVAPAGAKVLPIGSKIEQSQATPTAPVSMVAAGESKATFGGQTIETTIEKAANGPALLSAGPATIALAGFVDQPAASNNNSGGSTGLTASSSTPLEIATGSFIASTPVQVWLFSTPLLLAETTVDENGNFAAAINLPSSLASGSHTLQIQGYVYASGGAAEVTANIGISITRKTPKTWSTTFPMFSSAISARQKSTWQKFVADQKSPELSCALTPMSPVSRSAANLQLFNKRMLNVTTFLKLGGCTNITTVASAPLTKNSNINRTWTVAVEPQTTKTTFNWVHVFSLYSSKVRKTATTTWTMNVAAHADKVLACRVTAVEPAKKSRANTKLFDQRNNAISSYLIENSCDTVEFTQSIASKEPFANRQAWTVRVSTSAK